jgi:signal transduction histidine kinase
VAASGGTLTIESRPGSTTVSVLLPAASEAWTPAT